MSKTLAQIVSDVRIDLKDTDASSYRWSDAVLNRCVDRARARVQEVLPRERTADIAAVAGVRDYALASLTDLLWVQRVAFGASAGLSEVPRPWTPFEVWNGTLSLLVAVPPAGGETIRLYYAGAHAVDGSGNTLPPESEHLLALGAAVYAALEEAIGAIGRFGSSEETPAHWRAWVEARLREWDGALSQLRRTVGARGAPYTAGWTIE